MITPLNLDANWREYWGQFYPPAAAQLQPLELAGCYRPRMVLLPDLASQVVPDSGKIEYAFSLKAGSIVWGLYAYKSDTTAVQITDVNLGHKFFQEPVRLKFLTMQEPGLGTQVDLAVDFESMPYLLLPGPHPVVGDGLFLFEAWQTIATRICIVLLVAEVYVCED